MRAVALLALLAGCLPVTGPEWDRVQDVDGDGGIAVRFGGDDCADDNPQLADCDLDDDGDFDVAVGGTDCDDDDPQVGMLRWYRDLDDDLHGDPADFVDQCPQPVGFELLGDDCDPREGQVFPGNPETCDDLDRDCSGDPYDVENVPPYYADADGDGYGTGEVVARACVPPTGFAGDTGDCDDGSPAAFPGNPEVWYDGVDGDCAGGDDFDQDGDGEQALPSGLDCEDRDDLVNTSATERCNGVDDDCDGSTDNGVFADESLGAVLQYRDADGDGYGDGSVPTEYHCLDAAEGWVLEATDCDDTRDEVSPLGDEVCNNRDDDCNGLTDDNASDLLVLFVDQDGDNYGDAEGLACFVGPGLATQDGDCDDADPEVNPGATEICGDSFRQDCNPTLAFDDCDGDGFSPPQDCLDDPSRGPADTVFPNAVEICDGFDTDCDGLDDAVELTNPAAWPDWYNDIDGDGFGGDVPAVSQSCTPPPLAVSNSDDCDDGRTTTNPKALELCDGQDNDCNGFVDDADEAVAIEWFLDADEDGFGTLPSVRTCLRPDGYTASSGDCDDTSDEISPLGTETCAPGDEDCDGSAELGDPTVEPRLYADLDGDGFGDPSSSQGWCFVVPPFASYDGTDCDDTDPDISPGAPEECNAIDDDCDLRIDDEDSDTNFVQSVHLDQDRDGFGSIDPIPSCLPDAGAPNTDCDDLSASINPDGAESCAPGDENCDGIEDTTSQDVLGRVVGFLDEDGDGVGNELFAGCPQGLALVSAGGDCNDADERQYPEAREVCDTVDNDCDGRADDLDSSLFVPDDGSARTFAPDYDGDGVSPRNLRLGCAALGGEFEYIDGDPIDCDDNDPYNSPSLPEYCDGRDNDCDDLVDVFSVDAIVQYPDADGDGYGLEVGNESVCPGTAGWITRGGDCDDSRALANPSLDEVCEDAIDNDCDPSTPDTCSPVIDWFRDGDNDGYGDQDLVLTSDVQPPGYVDVTGDCNDGDSAINPEAAEVCDAGVDNDCDASTVEDCGGGGAPPVTLWWPDDDEDGWGDWDATASTVEIPGWVTNPLDCSDSDDNDVTEVVTSDLSTEWGLTTAACAVFTLDPPGTVQTIATRRSVPANFQWSVRSEDTANRATLRMGTNGSLTTIDRTSDTSLRLHGLDLQLAPSASEAPFRDDSDTGRGALGLSVCDVDGRGATVPALSTRTGSTFFATVGAHFHDFDDASGCNAFSPCNRLFDGFTSSTHDLLSTEPMGAAVFDGGTNLTTTITRATLDGVRTFDQDLQTDATVTVRDSTILGGLDLASLYIATLTFERTTVRDGDVVINGGFDIDLDLTDFTVERGGLEVAGGGFTGGNFAVRRTRVVDAPTIGLWFHPDNVATSTFEDLEIIRAGTVGVKLEPPTIGPSTLVDGLYVAGSDVGVEGRSYTVDHATLVDNGTGVSRIGAGTTRLDNSIVWGGGTAVSGSVTLRNVMFDGLAPVGATSVGDDPGFVRFDGAATEDTYDLRLVPPCSEAIGMGRTGEDLGYFPQLPVLPDSDFDLVPDEWELSWYGDLTSVIDDTDYTMCVEPYPYP